MRSRKRRRERWWRRQLVEHAVVLSPCQVVEVDPAVAVRVVSIVVNRTIVVQVGHFELFGHPGGGIRWHIGLVVPVVTVHFVLHVWEREFDVIGFERPVVFERDVT